MKNLLSTTIACIFCLSASAQWSQADVINATTGTIAGSGVTWTVTTNSGNAPSYNGTANGLTLGSTNASGVANKITIDFSAPVDFTITNHLTGGSALFSGPSPAATVVANVGSWAFTDDSAAIVDPNFTLNGNSFTVSELANGGGTHNSGDITSSDPWGQFDISGVTQVMYTAEIGSNNEALRFVAVAAAVPEPSSASLIASGMLGFLSRRKRKCES